MPNTETQDVIFIDELVSMFASVDWKTSEEKMRKAAMIERDSRHQNPHIQEGYYPGIIPSGVLRVINQTVKGLNFDELSQAKVGNYKGDENVLLLIARNGSHMHDTMEHLQEKTGKEYSDTHPKNHSKAVIDHGEIRIESTENGEQISFADFSLYEIRAEHLKNGNQDAWKNIQRLLE
jgi:hypothetical protein